MGPRQSDHDKWLITTTKVILSGFHCINILVNLSFSRFSRFSFACYLIFRTSKRKTFHDHWIVFSSRRRLRHQTGAEVRQLQPQQQHLRRHEHKQQQQQRQQHHQQWQHVWSNSSWHQKRKITDVSRRRSARQRLRRRFLTDSWRRHRRTADSHFTSCWRNSLRRLSK